jgi:hypothetical protein
MVTDRTTLGQALDGVHRLEDDLVIFARKPWSVSSEALIGQLDHELRVPAAIADTGFEYFIDVPAAKEVLGVFGGRIPTPEERRELLLYYAEHDAYPSWVHRA